MNARKGVTLPSASGAVRVGLRPLIGRLALALALQSALLSIPAPAVADIGEETPDGRLVLTLDEARQIRDLVADLEAEVDRQKTERAAAAERARLTLDACQEGAALMLNAAEDREAFLVQEVDRMHQQADDGQWWTRWGPAVAGVALVAGTVAGVVIAAKLTAAP